jgi:hypothetical protein
VSSQVYEKLDEEEMISKRNGGDCCVTRTCLFWVSSTSRKLTKGDKMMKRIGVCMLILAFCFTVTPVYAAGLGSLDFKASPWKANTGSKGEMAKAKLLFGLENTFFGWTEIFTETYEGFKGEKREAPWALFRGILNGVLDTVGGVAHVITSPCSHLDIPLPEGGTDVFK